MFGTQANPMLQLGAMGWFFYWVVIFSGIYLYIFFDTGVSEAYESVEYLTHDQWYAGGIMRSFHRYASDALVIVIFLHLIREYVMDRMHGPRYFSWVIGVIVLSMLYASGITGYWIVWDKLAQYIAIATSELLDTLPIFGEPIVRNFLHDSTLSGRFFTLFVFIHIAVPLIMLFFMWVHIQRISRPRVNPPKNLAAGTLIMLLVLSVMFPAVSQGPADLSQVPAVIKPDWFYMLIYPLLDIYPGKFIWGALFILMLLLFILPRVSKILVPAQIARVNLPECNGCGRCVYDCPYSAVTLQPRTDDLPYTQQAVVNPHLCTGCGICVGACPTATPLRRRTELVPGIELPDPTIGALRDRIMQGGERLHGNQRIIVFGCNYGHDVSLIDQENTASLKIPCIGMLPPSFIDFIISKDIADGVLLTGCREGECFQRHGIEWTRQRIARERDPYLRDRVPRERIKYCWSGSRGKKALMKLLYAFRESLGSLNGKTITGTDKSNSTGQMTCKN